MKTQIVKNCQICNSSDLEEIISLGYLPHPNVMQSIGSRLEEAAFIPHELLKCNNCSLVQLGCIVDQKIVFPPDYTYVSRTTKILQDNFAQLADEVSQFIDLKKDDLVIDIGSNDGTLLSNFKEKCKIQGIEPTNAAQYANYHDISTLQEFFSPEVANELSYTKGKAKIITACNVFAHILNINDIVESIEVLLEDDGIFISENHYLISLMKTNQWDVIYTEHLRYYSITSLQYLFKIHGMEIFDVKLIPTHGGSIRVYTCKIGRYKINDNVNKILNEEKEYLTQKSFSKFKNDVIMSKADFYYNIKEFIIFYPPTKIGAIGAPSRSTTLINYFGLNEDFIKFILEMPGSNKIDQYLPGTKIPIFEETTELLNSVDYLLLLSWHIADELVPKLRDKGFKGKFIMPLPYPHIYKE